MNKQTQAKSKVLQRVKEMQRVHNAWARFARREFFGFAAYHPNSAKGIPSSLSGLAKRSGDGDPTTPDGMTPFESYHLVLSHIRDMGDIRLMDAARLAVQMDNPYPYVWGGNTQLAESLAELVIRVAREVRQVG